MANLNLRIGYLWKKKYVIYEKKKYEIFELIDYVAVMGFTNLNHNDMCNVLSGNYSGIYASFINKNANEEEYVFLEDNLEEAVKFNDNRVIFNAIREKRLLSTGKYYLRGDSGTDLTKLVNQDLITYLQKGDKDKQLDFDENEF